MLLAQGATTGAATLHAQSLLDRSPNVAGTWTGVPGQLQFNFLHRFTESGSPERKVSNVPTLLLAIGLPRRVVTGFNYSSNSQLVSRYPNEWELFARTAPLVQEAGAPLDLSVMGAYNVAARSIDGELAAARRLGRLRVLGAVRVLSNAFDEDTLRVALAGGATLRIGRHLSLGGDVVSLTERRDLGAAGRERLAWSAGIQLAIPFTPHTLSLHATNTTTATLQGTTRAAPGATRYGFEFTVPITLRRYFGGEDSEVRGATVTPGAPAAARVASSADTVRVEMQNVAYAPRAIEIRAGATVEFRNADPFQHTVTADDRSFDSGLIEPGQTWRMTFDRPGTYPIHCTPHPFMKGVVVVR
jgi:plastocyanin